MLSRVMISSQYQDVKTIYFRGVCVCLCVCVNVCLFLYVCLCVRKSAFFSSISHFCSFVTVSSFSFLFLSLGPETFTSIRWTIHQHPLSVEGKFIVFFKDYFAFHVIMF